MSRGSSDKRPGPPAGPRTGAFLGRAIAVAILGVLFGPIRSGLIKVPLPYPAVGQHVHVVPGDVLPWRPRPLEGKLAPNTKLQRAARLFEGQIRGSESVAVSPAGELVMLDKFNRVWAAAPDASAPGGYALESKPRADLGAGRPLGYHFDAAGDLIVCDSLKGLIKLEWATGRVEILANTIAADSPIAPGAPITYANDLDIAPDGTVYFTSCSDIVPQRGAGGFWDTYKAWLLDFMRGAPRGRLLAYDPNTKRARALAEGFYYANGVAVASDGSYLLMVETNRLRVHRHWLQGPRAGETEVVIDRLPGAPDGVSRAADGNFWVAVLAPVPPVAKLLGEVGVRAAYAWLPDRLRPPLKSWGAVVKITGDGEVVDFLHDPTGARVAYVSAASEAGGRLYLGNLVQDYVSVLDL